MRNRTATKRRATPAQIEASKARRAELTEQVEAFEAEVEAGNVDGATMAALDRFMAQYSARNACLIVMQDPEATEVAGFKAWIERGRVVRRGETGIKILAPAGEQAEVKATPASADGPAVKAQAARRFFKLATVFDIRQTDELPAAKN